MNRFKEDGFFLIDAVEYLITTNTNSDRKQIILNDFPKLIEKIAEFNRINLMDHNTKIILIKKLVCELLREPIEDTKDITFDKSKGGWGERIRTNSFIS